MAARLGAFVVVALDRLMASGRETWHSQIVRTARGLAGRVACAVGLVVASGVSGAQSPGFAVSGATVSASTTGAALVPQAVGLIVKLRDAGATRAAVGSAAAPAGAASVVRIAASRTPPDSAESQQQRLTQALQRRGVRHLGHRATAFAARALRFDAPMSRDLAQLEAQRLRADPDVEWVVVDEVLQPQAAAYVGQDVNAKLNLNPDPDYGGQTWLQPRAGLPDRNGLANFPAAWSQLVGRTLTPVTVAVLDSGTLPAADLDGRMWPGYDFVSSASYSRDGNGLDSDPTDPGDWLTQADLDALVAQNRSEGCSVRTSEWHGLGVGYVLAAIAGNGTHGAGALAPLPGQVLLPVRVAGTCGAALSDIIEGMLWAAGVGYQGSPAANPHPARVINLSFGADGACNDTQVGSQDWLYQQTLASLAQKGALVVASAGNGDPKTGLGLTSPTRPASCAGVLAVTGLNTKGFKAGYANQIGSAAPHFGLAVASGDTIQQGGGSPQLYDTGFSTLTNNGAQEPHTGVSAYKMFNLRVGTSFAAPQAAAVAALMLAAEPRLTVSELLTMITDQVQPFLPVSGYPTCSDTSTGHCNCTVGTCGSGVLDAGLAVGAAITHTSQPATGGSIPGSDTVVSTFTPDRGAGIGVAKPSGSGGGGATDDLALGAVVALAALLAWRQTGRSGGRRAGPG